MTFRLTESESFRYCKTRDSDVGLSVVILPSNMACQIFIAKLFMSLRHDDFSCLLKFQAKIYNHMLFPISFIKHLLIYYQFSTVVELLVHHLKRFDPLLLSHCSDKFLPML